MKNVAVPYLVAAVLILTVTIAVLSLNSCGNNYVMHSIYSSSSPASTNSQITTIASALRSPSCLAFYGDYVYWTDLYEGKIYRTARGGGSTISTIASTNLSYPRYMCIVEPYIYIGEANPSQTDSQVNGIKRVDVNGTAAPTTLFSNQYPVGGIISDGTAVYWTQRILTNGTVRKGLLDGTTTTTDLATSLNRPSAITIQGTNLYYTVEGTTTDGATGSGDGLVGKIPTGGSGGITLASSLKLPVSISNDASSVFYCCEGAYSGVTLASTINKSLMEKPGTGTILTGQGRITKVFYDTSNYYLYYIEKDSSGSETGSIKKTNLTGTDVQIIASSQTSPGDLITDTTYVYWTTGDWSGNNGALYRCAK